MNFVHYIHCTWTLVSSEADWNGEFSPNNLRQYIEIPGSNGRRVSWSTGTPPYLTYGGWCKWVSWKHICMVHGCHYLMV